MRAIEKLHAASNDMKVGNHRVEYSSLRPVRRFIYFNTAIVVVNDNNRTFYTDNGGYGTVSTTRAINDHKKQLSGYTEVSKEEFKGGQAS